DRGRAVGGDHPLVAEHDLGVGGPRRSGVAGRLHAGRRAHRQYRSRCQPAPPSGRCPAMTAQTSWLLIAGGGVSALVGIAMMSATTARVRRGWEHAVARLR